MQFLYLSNVPTDWDVWRDILVPFICAVFGGLVTLIGLSITIKHENKKSKKDYLEKIRPFLVIESFQNANVDWQQLSDIIVQSNVDPKKDNNKSAYRINVFLLSNAGDAVFIVDYLKINNEMHKCIYKTSIRVNENARMYGVPQPIFNINGDIESISIGISDRLSNIYEYVLRFEVEDYSCNDNLSNICSKLITIKSVDCSKNLFKKNHKKEKRKN